MYISTTSRFTVEKSHRYRSFDRVSASGKQLYGYFTDVWVQNCGIVFRLLYRTLGSPAAEGATVAVKGSMSYIYPHVVIGSTGIQHVQPRALPGPKDAGIPRVYLTGNMTGKVTAVYNGDDSKFAFRVMVTGPTKTLVHCTCTRASKLICEVPRLFEGHSVAIIGHLGPQPGGMLNVNVVSFACLIYPEDIAARAQEIWSSRKPDDDLLAVGYYLPVNEPTSDDDAEGSDYDEAVDSGGNEGEERTRAIVPHSSSVLARTDIPDRNSSTARFPHGARASGTASALTFPGTTVNAAARVVPAQLAIVRAAPASTFADAPPPALFAHPPAAPPFAHPATPEKRDRPLGRDPGRSHEESPAAGPIQTPADGGSSLSGALGPPRPSSRSLIAAEQSPVIKSESSGNAGLHAHQTQPPQRFYPDGLPPERCHTPPSYAANAESPSAAMDGPASQSSYPYSPGHSLQGLQASGVPGDGIFAEEQMGVSREGDDMDIDYLPAATGTGTLDFDYIAPPFLGGVSEFQGVFQPEDVGSLLFSTFAGPGPSNPFSMPFSPALDTGSMTIDQTTAGGVPGNDAVDLGEDTTALRSVPPSEYVGFSAQRHQLTPASTADAVAQLHPASAADAVAQLQPASAADGVGQLPLSPAADALGVEACVQLPQELFSGPEDVPRTTLAADADADAEAVDAFSHMMNSVFDHFRWVAEDADGDGSYAMDPDDLFDAYLH